VRWSRLAPACLAVLLIGAAAARPLAGQGRGGDPQSRALLEAATLESNGDLDGAEAALRRLLDLQPTSTGAVFALERVLRAKGEAHELRSVVDAFLAHSPAVEVRALRLKLMAEADSAAAMEAEAEQWLAAEPRAAVFSAVAGVYEQTLGAQRALDVLGRGQARLGGNALALQTGDVLATSGDVDAAVDEWARSVAEDGAGMDAVRSRLNALGEERTPAARRLVQRLGAPGAPDSAERRRATLRLALEEGLEAEALAIVRAQADGISGRPRVTFLNEIAIQAREAGMPAVAAFAYAALSEGSDNPEERRPFELRIVDISLEAGDTVAALEAQRRVVASFASRSDEWRSALAEAIKLEATVDPERMADSWASFRSDFPNAPELDAVAAAIASSLQARGDAEGAARALQGMEGPRSSLERAYLLLGAGDLDAARAMLLRSVGGLSPTEATPVIQFASLLGRLSEPGKQALARAGVTAHRGHALQATEELLAAATATPSDAAPLLAEAGRLAERGREDSLAADIRRRLIEEHPDAPEVAEATLALARYTARTAAGEEEAMRMLEDLITTRPNAAVVPEARVELQRIRNRGS